MTTTPVASTLSPASQTAGTETTAENFKITDIPAAMDTLGWAQGARLMRKWFSGAAYELPTDIKEGSSSPNTLDPENLLTDLPFDWLFTSSTRMRDDIDELVAGLSNVTEFNNIVGHVKAPLDQLSRGLILLMTRLQRIGHLEPNTNSLRNAEEDFSSLSAVQLEETSQFNLIRIGASVWEKATDELDDVYGALGSFAIKIAATKLRTISDHLGYPAIQIYEIGLYIRDTYDFLNFGSDQLLGYWNHSGVIRPGPIDYYTSPEFIDKGESRYFKTSNKSFNDYRQKHNLGSDFLVFSTVKHYPVSIMIHLSANDFNEFKARASSI
ncbi:DUF6402 family protein [Pseudomonas sp. RL_15y_Pfl2_60]|uniref:DUF6402 family protein n=1 Tax=Pseudomonas sp. RL_15y_Pfl2_60 TaxID=3088709 RepID=UPI0030D98B97